MNTPCTEVFTYQWQLATDMTCDFPVPGGHNEPTLRGEVQPSHATRGGPRQRGQAGRTHVPDEHRNDPSYERPQQNQEVFRVRTGGSLRDAIRLFLSRVIALLVQPSTFPRYWVGAVRDVSRFAVHPQREDTLTRWSLHRYHHSFASNRPHPVYKVAHQLYACVQNVRSKWIPRRARG